MRMTGQELGVLENVVVESFKSTRKVGLAGEAHQDAIPVNGGSIP